MSLAGKIWGKAGNSKELRQIALDEDTTVQVLLAEGINAVLKKRGKKDRA